MTNDRLGTYPFGSPLQRVIQADRTPKRVFVLGVYASAVHARWLGPEVSAPPTAFFPPRGPIPTMPPWQGQPAHQLPNPLSTKQFYHCPATQSIRPLATKPSRQRRNARPEPVTRAKSIYLSCPASIKRLRVSTHRFGASSSTRRAGYSPITVRISCK